MLGRCGDKETEQEDGFAGVVRVGNLSPYEKMLFALRLHVPARLNPRYKQQRSCFDHLDSQIHLQVSLEVLLVLPDNSGQ